MRIIIATGGSGGHLFPAIKVANELESLGHDVLFLGSFDRDSRLMKGCRFEVRDLGAKGLPAKLGFRTITAAWAMGRALARSFGHIRSIKPDVVVGFGGYGAFPAVMTAIVLGIPTLIHEQNVVPGRANAILSKFVKRIAVSFDASKNYFKKGKAVLTGCPCRVVDDPIDRPEILKSFGLRDGRKTILVFGGSQGSHRINQVFLKALNRIKAGIDVQVIHIVGSADYTDMLNSYNLIGIPFALFEFLDKMEEAYQVSDIVISRSGAATVSEIAGYRLPAVLIPYPGAGGHQSANASVLGRSDMVRLIEEEVLNDKHLADAVTAVLNSASNVKDASALYEGVYVPDAAKRLANETVKLV